MTSDVTAEEKFSHVAQQYVDTYTELQRHPVDLELAAEAVLQIIQHSAAKAGVAESDVLEAAPWDWGNELARQTYRHAQERAAHADTEPDRQLPLGKVERLILTLDLALGYAAVNNADLLNRFSPEAAKDAKISLHRALNSRTSDSTVTVTGNTVADVRSALDSFHGNLRSRYWASCHCSTACKHRKNDKVVLRTVSRQLRLLR